MSFQQNVQGDNLEANHLLSAIDTQVQVIDQINLNLMNLMNEHRS
jgi:hypothetical protein